MFTTGSCHITKSTLSITFSFSLGQDLSILQEMADQAPEELKKRGSSEGARLGASFVRKMLRFWSTMIQTEVLTSQQQQGRTHFSTPATVDI